MKTRLTYALTAILTMATLAGCSSDDDDKYAGPNWLVGTSWKSNGRNYSYHDGAYYRWIVFTSKSQCEMFFKDDETGNIADKVDYEYSYATENYSDYVIMRDASGESTLKFFFYNDNTQLVPSNTSLNYYLTRQ